MAKGSQSILGLALVFLPGVTARADTIPGVTVERVVLGGSEGEFVVELRVTVESQTQLLIDEGVPATLIAANVSDGGVLLGVRIGWTAIVSPGLTRFSY